MFRSSWVTLAVACSFSTMLWAERSANYSLAELKEELSKESSSASSRDEAKREAKALVQKIRNLVMIAYDAALKEGMTSTKARDHVLSILEKDISQNVASELQGAVRDVARDALADAMRAPVNSEVELRNLQKISEENNRESRAIDLKEEGTQYPADKKHFDSYDQLLKSMTSGGQSVRWTTTSNQNTIIGKTTRQEEKRSFQLKAEFLGTGIDAGPVVEFSSEITVKALLMVEGYAPAILEDGRLDYFQKNSEGADRILNDVKARRHVAFACEAEMFSQAELKAGVTLSAGIASYADLSFAGVGKWENSRVERDFRVLTATTRRVIVPETINGKMVTVKTLNDICLKYYLDAKVYKDLTVKGTLDKRLQDLVSNLYYSTTKTKCGTDNHCYDWYKYEITSILKRSNIPRCITNEELNDKRERTDVYRICQLRGLKYQACPVFDEAGKLASTGMFEYTCDQGLKCVTVEKAGFMKYAVGRCMPMDSKSYTTPKLTPPPKYEDPNIIDVDIISE